MGVEREATFKKRKGYLQDAILGVLVAAGAIAFLSVAPAVAGALPHVMGKKRSQLLFKSRTALGRLAARGHVRFVSRNGKKYAEITESGRRALAFAEAKARAAEKGRRRWDGHYRLVIFDVPEARRAVRDRLRGMMRSFGFLQIQKSVWLHPHDCEDIVALLKADLRIGKQVLYAVVRSIENDGWIKEHFNLGRSRLDPLLDVVIGPRKRI